MSSVRKIPKALQEKAQDELNENPKQVQHEIENLRAWITQQKHLRIKTDDQWLLTFLRGCKYNPERVRQKLTKFYTTRSNLPELYSNRDPFLPEIQEILSLGLCLPLTKLAEPDSPRIVLIRCHPADPTKIQFVNVMKVCLMIVDVLLNEDDNFNIAGQIGFLDLQGMSVSHALHLDLNVCRKAAMCLQNAYPTRPKSFHFVNTPGFFMKLYHIMKYFVTAKIRNRIEVYDKNGLEELYTKVSLDVLPEEYGGNGGKLEEITSFWKKKVESYKDWFLDDTLYGCDKKCVKKFNKVNEVVDSFKHLDID